MPSLTRLPGGALLLTTLTAFAGLPGAVAAQSAQVAYNEAFTKEHEGEAFAEALALYREVIADPAADVDLRARAERRARIVAEELAALDLATVFPKSTLVYVELGSPGGELTSLIDQLGLLGTWEGLLTDASGFAISPRLIESLLGVDGAAAGITGIPMGGGPPPGVAVLHPGDVELFRGVLETALPAGLQAVEPVSGHPTFDLEGQALVTMLERLVVVSTSRREIDRVIERIHGERDDTLARSESMIPNLALRNDDLVYACLNFAPLRPLIAMGLAQAAKQDPRAAMVKSLFDIGSLDALVARMGVDDDGLSVETVLRLHEGHQNLAFHFVRGAPVDRETLALVPAGSAAFVSAAFNQRGPALRPIDTDAHGHVAVSALDLGREVFGNLVGMSLFVMPGGPARGAVPVSLPNGMPLPEVAAVFSSNDPERSRALWDLGLGVANLMGGGVTMHGGAVELVGHTAEEYRLPNGMPLYVVGTGTALVVSPSRAAIEHALETRSRGSVLDDPEFASAVDRVGEGSTAIVALHAGRLAGMAGGFVPAAQAREVQMAAALCDRTVLSVVQRHTWDDLGLSLALTGLPDLGPLVNGLLDEGMGRGREFDESIAEALVEEPEVALAASTEAVSGATDTDVLLRRFDLLAKGGEHEAAVALGRGLLQVALDDPRAVNNFAWALLTEERYGGAFDALALELSLATNEATGHERWEYLDTLALARFRLGDVKGAIEAEERALELVGEGESRAELQKALERFRAAANRVSDVGI